MGRGGRGEAPAPPPSLPLALYPLQTLLQVVQVGGRRGGGGAAAAAVGRGVGVRVVLLLVQLPGLLELRQLAVEHVGGGGHRRLGRQQRGDGRSLQGLLVAAHPLEREETRDEESVM